MDGTSNPQFRPVPPCRRVVAGHAYDTSTASVLFHDYAGDDPCWMGAWPYDMGSALLLNRWEVHFVFAYNYELDPWAAGYEVIRPVTRSEAIDWASHHCPGLVEKIFGPMSEAGEADPYGTAVLNTPLPRRL